jgi:arsenical pump membrane protein
MALIHSHALAGGPDALVLAALVGGDLGPRLLPIGSLAGLLWIQQLRRSGVTIPLRTFVTVGAVVTVPSLAASLAALWLVG